MTPGANTLAPRMTAVPHIKSTITCFPVGTNRLCGPMPSITKTSFKSELILMGGVETSFSV